MKLKNNFIWNTLLPFILIGLVALTGCQKDDLNLQEHQDDVTLQEHQVAGEETPTRSLERLILERYFLTPTDGLAEKEIAEKYNEMASLLPEETQSKLNDLLERAEAQQRAYAGSTDQLNFRSSQSESILTGQDQDFGISVTVFANRIYVGSPNEQKVYEYKVTGGTPTLQGEITPSMPAEEFGFSISVFGNRMAIAAPGSFVEEDPGQIFVFKKQGNTWVEQAILNGPDGEANFGSAVVLKANTLVASSSGLTPPFPEPSIGGTISVFKRTGNDWTLSASLFQPGKEWSELDLDDSGNRIVANSITLDGGTFDLSTSTFSKVSNVWGFEQELVLPSEAFFNFDVAIDGDEIVVTTFEPGDRQWLFTRNGGTWEFAQELVYPVAAPSDGGANVDIKSGRIVIGQSAFDGAISDAVYAFDKAGGTYQLAETFTPSDGAVNVFIADIEIRSNRIVIGCPRAFTAPDAPGKAYVFK